MDIINALGIALVPAISGCCYVVGEITKRSPIEDDLIPACCLVSGGILGLIALYGGMDIMSATDPITAFAVGALSGLAATGINQIYKQATK